MNTDTPTNEQLERALELLENAQAIAEELWPDADDSEDTQKENS